jgi:hypothetical protein
VIAADFGPLVVETDVDKAILAVLELWLPTHLSQVERERHLSPHTLARPTAASYSNVLEDAEFLDHGLPAILVTTAESTDYHRGPEGLYSASYRSVVSCVVRGRSGPESREVGALFAGAVKRSIAQNADLDGIATQSLLESSSLQPVADSTDKGRYLVVAQSHWNVYVDDVLQSRAGPAVPASPYDDPDPVGTPDTPFEPLVTVTEITSDIRGVPIPHTPGDS